MRSHQFKLCCCILVFSHIQTKSFVKGKPPELLQLSNELLNFKHFMQDQLKQTNPEEENKHPEEVRNWPRNPLDREIPMLGQISGVAVKENGNPVIFHRGLTQWTSSSFNDKHQYNHFDRSIGISPVVELDAKTGAVVKSWGENLFYLPHSVTIDSDGNYWFTDVALHQVIKMKEGDNEPLMTIGEARVPGSDDSHFCKPTDVAVSSTGLVFVSDGYCNSRIMKFDKDGKCLTSWGEGGELYIPHAVTLLESRDMLCVADREHNRVMCYQAKLESPESPGKLLFSATHQTMGPVYGVASYDRAIFAVTSPRRYFNEDEEDEALTIDADTGDIIDRWAPHMGFNTPHAIAVSKDGDALYVAQIGEAKLWKFI